MAHVDTTQLIGDIVLQNHHAADLLKSKGIDYSSDGRRTLEKACSEAGISATALENELAGLPPYTHESTDPASLNIDELIDYIVDTHHVYMRDALPRVAELTSKAVESHGETQPELIELQDVYGAMMHELREHTRKEEQVLFPYVKRLQQLKQSEANLSQSQVGSVQAPINVMETEHSGACDALRRIRSLTNEYSLPNASDDTLKALYSELQTLENDIWQHIHLENNILHPRAIALEAELVQQ